MNQFELRDRFPTEKAIIKEYIRHRYGFYVTCNHCKSKRVVQLKNRPKFYQCNGCNKTFSIFKGTIFEKTRVSLLKWMLAINFVCNNKKSLPALQFQREIGGDYRTSWRMLHQIRKAMSRKANKEIFELIVEVDETYVGGKPRKGARKRS
ncbi:MAG: IS1595 family transposase, partial [Leptospiraceae bacterium]|nr:IS1595 family transposase [Leptospiraceae bacterium]